MPNGTYARTTFDAWSQIGWDPNDTNGEAGNAWTAARSASVGRARAKPVALVGRRGREYSGSCFAASKPADG